MVSRSHKVAARQDLPTDSRQTRAIVVSRLAMRPSASAVPTSVVIAALAMENESAAGAGIGVQ
jgi:hypothetical protein